MLHLTETDRRFGQPQFRSCLLMKRAECRFRRSKPKARGSKLLMIRKLSSGKFRLYSRKKNPKTGKRRNLGTFDSRQAAEKHERAIQFYKRAG